MSESELRVEEKDTEFSGISMANQHTFAIGIDLGTSNCAMAYIDLRNPDSGSHIFEIPQYETLDRIARHSMLPSFAYYTQPGELLERGPSSEAADKVVGVFARSVASNRPERVVHSAKSWLCHMGIDREAGILPWQSDALDQHDKLSPIEASALFLGYLRRVWNETMARDNDDYRFDNQQIIITVPASFDQDAQRLTLEAAYLAGFPRTVRLLEEPQAAFHAWLEQHPDSEALQKAVGAQKSNRPYRALVCDIGGGTTDMSLFSITFSEDQQPKIERTAVSEHILLGGDNVDITIAQLMENRISSEQKAPASYRFWQSLINRCRELKEQALADTGREDAEFKVAVAEPGASLFTETRQAVISRSEILEIVNEGFFPRCEISDRPRAPEGGLREAGLPYAHDPAVTHYIADFLSNRLPVDVVLFNGGTLTPLHLRDRLIDQIAHWQEGQRPSVLENSELYFSVARGAAHFGREIALGEFRLITAGASHGYYLQINPEQDKEATYLVCILPLGTDIESPVRVRKLDLHLLVNQPVEFKAHSTVKRTKDHTGQLIKHNEQEFTPLPPLQTIARLDARAYKLRSPTIPVDIETRLNALGLLQVYLVSATKAIASSQHWKLEFNIRAGAPKERTVRATAPLPEDIREKAFKLLESRFDLSLIKQLEKITRSRKNKWSPGWLREFWKPLSETVARRKQGEEYEAAWLNAAGFFLRPGYGVALDDFRMDQFWAVYDLGLDYPSVKSVREQWYVMWRRVSGGLDSSRQTILYRDVKELLTSHIKAAVEAFRMAASFEYLSSGEKRELFCILMEGVQHKRPKLRGPYLWSLGRLLGRVPLYAGEQAVMSPELVEQCFTTMKEWDWREPGMEYTSTLFALACRKTARRELDVSQDLRNAVADKMRHAGAREELVRQVIQFIPLENEDYKVIYGESLPVGLAIREFS
ncbi:MAG: Hsp70 family protein [Chitinivibrionales bacterium]|nr:Hsp70 family protein [Chitinivibrionales bacterium]